MRILRTTLVFVGLLGAFVAASGCNTVEGFGEDMQKGGRAIEREAND